MGIPQELPFFNTNYIQFEKKVTENTNILFYRKMYNLTSGKRETKKIVRKRSEVPLWEKATLTLEEAAEFSGIGIHKIRELTDAKNCKFILWNGNRRLIKRKKFEEFIDESFSI